MIGNRLKHWTAILFPVLISLYLYRRSFRIWFLADDFAWLGLRLSIFNLADLGHALFGPMAQGTVRTLSERLFFLGFEWGFGMESLPMRLWMFLTMAVAQVLLVLVVRRLTGSLGTGVVAALLWALNFGLTVAMSWLSSYNQMLISALVLGALYCFMRYAEAGDKRWLAGSWGCYLAGFGTLESIVVLPGILLVWAYLFDRERWRASLPFFVPAILFVGAHFLLIPKTQEDPAYRMHFDSSLFTSVGIYWGWMLGATRIVNFGPDWTWLEFPSKWILTPALLGYVGWSSWRRDYVPLFGLLLSLALIAPMLPLRDHRTDYYLASASMGVMIALASMPFRLKGVAGYACWVLLLIYAFPSWIVQGATFEWYLARTGPVRVLMRGLQHAVAVHPGKLILLEGIDEDLYSSALADDALRLVKAQNVRLLPGNGPKESRLSVAPATARTAFEQESVVVYRLEGPKLRDVTREWEQGKALTLSTGLSPELIAGDAVFASQFGEGWYPVEDGKRWLGASGRVRLGGPFAMGAKLSIQAYAPAALGKAQLAVRVNGKKVGQVEIEAGSFSVEIPIPQEILAAEVIEVALEMSKTVRTAQDGRQLSLVFGQIGIR